MFKILSSFCVLFFVAILGCTTEPTRMPQSAGFVPSPEEVFARGKFMIQPNKNDKRAENHYGQDLVLDTHRPPFDLTATIFQTKYGKSGYKVFANFFHDNKFWIARVPDQGVTNVSLEVVYFPIPQFNLPFDVAAHTFLRFDFAPGKELELVAEMPSEQALLELAGLKFEDAMEKLHPALEGSQYKIKNVGVSMEATWAVHDPDGAYNFIRGMHGAFIATSRFVSLNVRMHSFYNDGGDPTHQYRYPLRAGEGDKILAKGLEIGQKNGLSTMYDTVKYNCATTAFDTIEQATGIAPPKFNVVKIFDMVLVNYPIFNPLRIEKLGAKRDHDMATDPSVIQLSKEAYEAEIKNKQVPLCPHAMDKRHCQYLNEALSTLKKAGLE